MRTWKKPCRLTEILDDGQVKVTEYVGGVRKARNLLRTGIEWGRLTGGIIEHEGSRETFQTTADGGVEVRTEQVDVGAAA